MAKKSESSGAALTPKASAALSRILVLSEQLQIDGITSPEMLRVIAAKAESLGAEYPDWPESKSWLLETLYALCETAEQLAEAIELNQTSRCVRLAISLGGDLVYLRRWRDIQRGEMIVEGARKGARKLHGAAADIAAKDEKLRAEYTKLLAEQPQLKKYAACVKIGARHDVSYKTVARAVENSQKS